jgi:predicted AlkP superfamily pyrophosphatase or phosphodiesterase
VIFLIKRIKNIDYIMLLSILLIISVIFNIYTLFKLNNYKYKIGQESYTKIEDFRQRNESNMDILSKGVEENSLKSEDLLKLYRNYDAMSGDIIELWQQYGSYTQNTTPFFSKIIKTDKMMENDIHGKIKEYMLSIINKEMKNEESKIQLKNEDLQSFKDMYEISSRIYEYFNKFNEETMNGIAGEDKEKKVIKEHYWIDMLEGIYNISNDYVNLQWKLK